jgi:hypothetical protein
MGRIYGGGPGGGFSNEASEEAGISHRLTEIFTDWVWGIVRRLLFRSDCGRSPNFPVKVLALEIALALPQR